MSGIIENAIYLLIACALLALTIFICILIYTFVYAPERLQGYPQIGRIEALSFAGCPKKKFVMTFQADGD